MKNSMDKETMVNAIKAAGGDANITMPFFIIQDLYSKISDTKTPKPVEKQVEQVSTPTPEQPLASTNNQSKSTDMTIEGFKMLSDSIAGAMKEGFSEMSKQIASIKGADKEEELPEMNNEKYLNILGTAPKQSTERTYVIVGKDADGNEFLDHTSTSLKTWKTKESLQKYLDENKYRNYKLIPIN